MANMRVVTGIKIIRRRGELEGRWHAVQKRYVDGQLANTVVVDPKGQNGFDTEDQARDWANKIAFMTKELLDS